MKVLHIISGLNSGGAEGVMFRLIQGDKINSHYVISLTDEGFETGSSGTKIFTGSTPLTGTASPQVAVRWKIVGSSLTGANKIHGVALQWA